MTVTHVGSTKQYAEGWDGIFAGGAKRGKASSKPRAATTPKKKAAAKKK